MAGLSGRRLWRPVLACSLLVAAISVLAGAAGQPQLPRPAGVMMPRSLRMLQLNLCDSGIAGCYTGRSVHEAGVLIATDRPEIVTLNEVCRDDVSVLERAMSRADGGATVAAAFQAAVDRRTSQAFRCVNGRPYGIAIVASVGASYQRYAGIYPSQDNHDPEERAWLCVHGTSGFYVCTTHLASTSPTVALAQCRYLVDTALPAVRARGGDDPMVLGGDLNLRSNGSPDVESCLPPGSVRADDGGVQHVVGISDFTVRSSRTIDMHGTTDHPGLLVDLAIRA